MTKQLNLNLQEKAQRVRVQGKLAARMIAYLERNQRWVKRDEFRQQIGLSDRACRLGREASHARIISGPDGYQLLKYSTPIEIRGCMATQLSQIIAMQENYGRLVRRSHAMLAGEENK